MTIAPITYIISRLNEIEEITRSLYNVESRRILHVKATKITDLTLLANKWAFTLEKERQQLEDRVLELENELRKIRGEPLTASESLLP